MTRRWRHLIVLLAAAIFLFPQVAGALAPTFSGTGQSAGYAKGYDGSANNPRTERLMIGDAVGSPALPFPDDDDCKQDLGGCTAIMPKVPPGQGSGWHRSFTTPSLKLAVGALVTPIPPPPKLASSGERI